MADADAFEEECFVKYCSNKEELTNCNGLRRITCILSIYSEWCESKNSENDDDDTGMYNWIYEMLPNYNHIKLLNDYNHLLIYHRDQFHEIYNILISKIYDDTKLCSYDKCSMLSRNNRDRTQISNNSNIRKQMYHGFDKSTEVNVQQTCDRMHCFYMHSYDLGFKLTPKDLNDILKSDEKEEKKQSYLMDIDPEDNDDDNEHDNKQETALLRSDRLKKVRVILDKRRERDGRHRNRNNRASNKFVTIVDDNKRNNAVISNKSVNENDDNKEYNYSSSDDNNALHSSDDDDPLQQQNDDEPTMLKQPTLQRPRTPTRISDLGGSYSFGFRYYYWNYYRLRDCAEIGDLEPGNPPYDSFKKWFIGKKHATLKEEIVSQKFISIEQWNDTTDKAINQLDTDEIGKSLQADAFGYYYGVRDGDRISLHHIISVLLYCNYDKLQAKFTETYRRIGDEDDESLKKRHSEFANWGRYLRETVELFGQQIDGNYYDYESKQAHSRKYVLRNKYYHGINCHLLFSSTIARFNGPTSTTTQIAVALTFSDQKGLCLQLVREKININHLKFFNCVPLSDFGYEEERLFIGGFEPLFIATIIDTKINQNYRIYLRVLNNIQYLIEGEKEGWAISKVTDKQSLYIHSMFKNHSLNDKLKENPIPPFILNLFRAYCLNVRLIDLNLESLNSEEGNKDEFGFMRVRDIFIVNEETQWVKYDYLCQTFGNVEQIKIRSGASVNSVLLNKDFFIELLSFIKSSHVVTRYTSLESMIFYQPNTEELNLDKAVKKYGGIFGKHKWKLTSDKKHKLLILQRSVGAQKKKESKCRVQ